MKNIFLVDRKAEIQRLKQSSQPPILTEEKLSELPTCLGNFFRLCGFVGKPIAMNADIVWKESYLKFKPNSDWKKLDTIQFNSVNPIMRTAYMKVKGMPFAGKDFYRAGNGSMIGQLFGFLTLFNSRGKELSQSALITSFSESLILSGYAFQPYSQWTELDNNTLEATLTDNGITVKGLFHFDDEGLFTSFESDDRYFDEGKGKFSKKKFKIAIDSYKKIGEFYQMENVRAIWCLAEGEFTYYKGTIDKLNYNVTI